MQGKFALDIVEGEIGFRGIHAFMRFINDQKIPFQRFNPLQFVIVTTEIKRALQILQRDKGNHVFLAVGLPVLLQKLLAGQYGAVFE